MSSLLQHTIRPALIALLLQVIDAEGQVNLRDAISVTATYHTGFVLSEYSNLTYVVEDRVQSAAISVTRRTKGKNIWEQLYNFPEYGISLFYSTLGNDKIHGRELALFPHFALKIISRNKFDIYTQDGVGIGYVTRKYNSDDNYLNIAVGSHLNIHLDLRLGVRYRLTEKLLLQSGICFNHFSNAGTRNPNLGLNFVTGFTALEFQIGNRQPTQYRPIEPYHQKSDFELTVSTGSKRPIGLSNEPFVTASASCEWKWHPFRVVHFGLGTDVFYDTSTETEMLALQRNEYKSINDFRTGLHISQEFMYGTVSLILQQGIYLGLTDKVFNRRVFNRTIIRYRPIKNVFVQVAMKSHLNILDYPELGLGCKL
jgi:hypothetical protein